MKNFLVIEGKKYISSREASRLTGYSSDYVGQLSRSGKIEARFVGRSWYVGEESLLKYKNLGLEEASKFRPSANREPDFARFFGKVVLTAFVGLVAVGSSAYALSFPFPKILEVASTIEKGLVEKLGPEMAYFEKIKAGVNMLGGDVSVQTASIFDSFNQTISSTQLSVKTFFKNFLGIKDTQFAVQTATSTTIINHIVKSPTTYSSNGIDKSYVDKNISSVLSEIENLRNFQSRQTTAIYNSAGAAGINIVSSGGGGISDLSSFDTADLLEGTNLYFTDNRVLSSLSSATSTTFGGDVTATTFFGDGSNLTGLSSFSSSTTRGAFSSSATGLDYSTTTGDFSLTSGYEIPLSASTTEWANKVSSQWGTSGSNIYYNTGNVGIGTSTPAAFLHVLGTTEQLRLGYSSSVHADFTVNSSGALVIRPGTGQGRVMIGQYASDSGYGTISLHSSTPSATNYNFRSAAGPGHLYINAPGASDYLYFQNGAVTKMAMSPEGNFGIGSSTPSLKLTVTGDAYFGGNVTATGTLSIGSSSPATLTNNGAGALTIAASGTNQNVVLTPSGSGYITASSQIRGVNGTVSVAAFSVNGANNGIYTASGSRLGFTNAGIAQFETGVATPGIILGNSGYMGFANAAAGANGTVDSALYRNAAGALEVNSGTAGTWRDLIVRNLSMGTTSTSTTLTVQGEAGKNPFNVASSTGTSLLSVTQSGGVSLGTGTGLQTLTGTASGLLVSDYQGNAGSFYAQSFKESHSFSALTYYGLGFGGTSASNQIIGWTNNSTYSPGDARDTGLFRNSAGTVEINSGTAGTFRDLIVRNLSMGTTSTSTTLTVQGDPGKSVFNFASSTGTSLLSMNQAGQLTTANGSSLILKVNNGSNITFWSDSSVYANYFGSGNACLSTPSTGLATINACAGTTDLRDLGIRNLSMGTSSQSATLTLQGVAGKNPFSIASSTGTNLLTVTQAGNVGIGITAPTVALDVVGQGKFSSAGTVPVIFNGTSQSFNQFTVAGSVKGYIGWTALGDDGLAFLNAAGGAANLLVTDAGNVGIGSTTPSSKLTVGGDSFLGGNVTATGTLALTGLSLSTTGNYLCIDTTTNQITSGTTCTLSSGRFKQNVQDLNLGLNTVLALRPVAFNFKQGYGDNGSTEQLGFVAEEADAIDPRLVPHDKDGLASGFNYQNYTAVLTKAIQEQQIQINTLKNATTTLTTVVQEVSATTTAAVIEQSSSFITTIANAVKNIISSAGELIVSTIRSTLAVFDRVETKTAAVSQGLEMTDQATGTIYCVVIKNGEWDKKPGTCAEVAAATSTPTIVVQTPTPVVVVPAVITPDPISTSTPEIITEIASSTPIVISTSTPEVSTSTPPVETVVTPIIEATSTPEVAPVVDPTPTPEPAAVSVDITQ